MACWPTKSPARGCEGSYRQTASDDIIRQFRYYLINQNLPEIALRFRDAVRYTIETLRAHPFVGARYRSTKPEIQKLRSWPVAGFEAIRIYYLANEDAIHVIRILHCKRDVKRILAGDIEALDQDRES